MKSSHIPVAPVLTQDQINATNAFLDFLVSDEQFFVIQGAAGTGKSFLIRNLLETFYGKYSAYCLLLQCDRKKFDIRITATTNKAVNVIADYLQDLLASRKDLKISTIYSLLGLKVTNDRKTGKTTLTASNNQGPDVLVGGSNTPLVFIDEASFISEELHEIITATLKNNLHAKIVYIGDKYQLAPVGQTFSAMDFIQCPKVSLNEVIRNGGHILATGTQFRKTVETGVFQPIHYNGVDIIHARGPEFKTRVEQSFMHHGWDPGVSKILAWTNETVQAYNQHIRKTLGLPEQYSVGEYVITNEFINGPSGFMCAVDTEVEITAFDKTPIDIFGVTGNMVEIDHAYVSFLPTNFADAKALMKKLAADKDWSKFFEVKETWFDLRPVYASSIHKAQGSTYDTVFLDLADIGKNWNATDVARLLYVGITRAAKQVVCYGFLPDRYC